MAIKKAQIVAALFLQFLISCSCGSTQGNTATQSKTNTHVSLDEASLIGELLMNVEGFELVKTDKKGVFRCDVREAQCVMNYFLTICEEQNAEVSFKGTTTIYTYHFEQDNGEIALTCYDSPRQGVVALMKVDIPSATKIKTIIFYMDDRILKSLNTNAEH